MTSGLLGRGISYTFSPEIHRLLGLDGYQVFDTDDASGFISKKQFDFINITKPYKSMAFEMADDIDSTAADIKAANLLVNNCGRLTAYNTDIYGLKAAIGRKFDTFEGMTVLLLGTGGAAHAAKSVCTDLDAGQIIMASHSGNGDIGYECLADIADKVDIIINCTPIGTSPKGMNTIIDAHDFANAKGYFDLVYNPFRTKTLQDFADMGVYTQNGLYMLVAQAAYAQQIALCNKATADIDRVYSAVIGQKQNIVLTGMPGCGKSTLGSMLAAKLSKEFVDTDELFYKHFAITPKECIESNGESDFRFKEKQIVASIADRHGAVISTGGGTISDRDNFCLLRQNGYVVYLHRELSELKPLPDRPLSDSVRKLKALYNKRIDIYRSHCDCIIDDIDDNDYDSTLATIIKKALNV